LGLPHVDPCVADPGLGGVRPSLTLDAEHWVAVRRIVAHDLGTVRRRLLDREILGVSVVDEALREYRRYVVLARLSAPLGLGEPLGMFSPEVDEVWHAHLLHTHDYAAFCDEVFGGFLHHEPLVGRLSEDASLAARCTFVRTYHRVFEGPFSPLWRLDATPETLDVLVAALGRDAAARDALRAAYPSFGAALLAE
jgi:hypothetical protein